MFLQGFFGFRRAVAAKKKGRMFPLIHRNLRYVGVDMSFGEDIVIKLILDRSGLQGHVANTLRFECYY